MHNINEATGVIQPQDQGYGKFNSSSVDVQESNPHHGYAIK